MEKLILAIETSGKISSISILKNDLEIDFRICAGEVPSSNNLLPAISELLRKNNLQINDFDLQAVSVGPGSLTGIRVGIAVAKGLTFGNESKRMAVNTLEAMALSCETDGKILAVLSNKKGSVILQTFQIENGKIINSPGKIITTDVNVLHESNVINNDFTIVCSDSLKELLKSIYLKQNIYLMPENLAFYIGKVAYNKSLSGEYFETEIVSLIP